MCADTFGCRTRHGVWEEQGTGVVFGAIDAIGIGSECIDLGHAIDLDGERGQKLNATTTTTIAAYGDGALTAGDQYHRRFEGLLMIADFSYERCVDLGHFSRFAGDGVTQHDGRDLMRTKKFCRRLQALMRRTDHRVSDMRQYRITGLGRLVDLASSTGLKVREHRGGRIDLKTLDDVERITVGAGIRASRPGGNRAGVIASDIADDEGEHRGAADGCQAATLYARQMLSDDVHFGDGGTGPQQTIRDRLEVSHGHAVHGQGEQTGTTARNQCDQQIILGQGSRQREDFGGGLLACAVRYRMASLQDADTLGGHAVGIARDH